MNKKAIILLSGGIDSTATLVYAINQGYECYAISFDYNQKHKIELEYAKKIAKNYKVKEHKIIKLDINNITKSALINENIKVPKYQYTKDLPNNIPVTYVPARNTLFLSYALSWAESLGITKIFVGANKNDKNGYPDCRPVFFRKFEELANIGTSFINSTEKIKIITPFINSKKEDIINFGVENNINLSETFTCYDPINNKPCGQCYSCTIRNDAFERLKQRI